MKIRLHQLVFVFFVLICSFCFFVARCLFDLASLRTLKRGRGYGVQPRLTIRSPIIKQRGDHDFAIEHQIRHNLR